MKLYDFQQDDVNYLKHMKSRLIANEMGTGKTLEAIELDRINTMSHVNTLVVAPLSTLKSTWEEHFKLLSPKRVITINPKNRSEFVDAVKADKHDVYICHWEALSRPDMNIVLTNFWGHIIADEAHRLKNRHTKQSVALKHIEADYKTAVTGTPMLNSPDELWGILNWLFPMKYRSYWKF